MFVSITLPIHEVLCPSTSFSMLPNFFNLIFLFLVNNCWRWCWFLMLTLEFWFHTSCQEVFVKHIVNHPSFQKFQLKCFWANIIQDPKCYETLNTNNFLFYFLLFFLILLFFSLFYFPGKTMKKACDKEVTWHVTWCDITSLEHDGRV